MTNLTNEMTLTILDAVFANYGEASGDVAAGFVSWAYDQREETLAILDRVEPKVIQLADDVLYTAFQFLAVSDEFDGVSADDLDAIEWLMARRDELAEALRDSLATD